MRDPEQPPQKGAECVAGEPWVDSFSRQLASGVSRRCVLKGIAAMAVSGFFGLELSACGSNPPTSTSKCSGRLCIVASDTTARAAALDAAQKDPNYNILLKWLAANGWSVGAGAFANDLIERGTPYPDPTLTHYLATAVWWAYAQSDPPNGIGQLY